MLFGFVHFDSGTSLARYISARSYNNSLFLYFGSRSMEIQNCHGTVPTSNVTDHISEVYFRLHPGITVTHPSSITPFIKPHCDDAVIKKRTVPGGSA